MNRPEQRFRVRLAALAAGGALLLGLFPMAGTAFASIGSVVIGAQTPNPVTVGNSATYTVTTTTDAPRDTKITVSGLPAGATPSSDCVVSDAAGSTQNTLTIVTTGSTPPGTSPITLTVTATDVNAACGTGVVNATSPGHTASLVVAAGTFTKLQVLVPGETAAPGTSSGKTGTPTAQAAGTPFTVTVNAVDANWNVVSSTHTVGITSSDLAATLPANAALVAGTKTFSVTLNTAGSPTVTATDLTDGTKTASTSPPITVAGPFTKLQLLVPGEAAAPGTASGKTGTPTAQAAGTAFTVTVNAVDANWNVVGSTDTVGITSSDAAATLPANAALVAGTKTFSVTLNTVGSRTVTATDLTDGARTASTSPAITVNAAFTKLQLLVPGETAAPGTATGKTGTPTAQAAGTAFTVTVNAVDANWNVMSSTDTVGITSSDVHATLPVNAALVAGTKTFSVTLNTAGSPTVTATDLTDGTKTASTSPAITVNAGAFTKLQVLVPGETAAPGTATGKTGTPTVQTAGAALTVTVNAVDANWNVVSSTHTVGITSSDAAATLPVNAALVAGTKTFSVTLNTVGSRTVTATDVTDTTKTASTSPAITVNAVAFTKLQVLVPGETAAPGTATGKTGTPTVQTAGTAFTVTVNAVDANWNIVSSTHTVGITSSDLAATLPANAALVAGTKTFSVTLNTVGSRTVTATDITDATKTANTSAAITVAGTFAKLQLLVPGETAAPGTASGKTGTPTVQTAGTAFTVTVHAVDATWNVVSSTHTVGITSSDAAATLPVNAALVAGTGTFSVTLKTVGTRTVTATDITDTTKTASTSPAITVNAGAFTKLQLLVPGETAAPGTATGKTGTPTVQTAGAALTVTVNAVDATWNVVSSTHTVGITSSDAAATLPVSAALVAGTKTFSVTLKTIGSRTVTATDVTDATKTASTSAAITVVSPAVMTLLRSTGMVTYGASARLSVQFAANGGSRAVFLEYTYAGIPWTTVASTTTNSTGFASATYKPARSGYYRIRFDGATDLSAAYSNVVLIGVRQTITLNPTHSGTMTIAKGRSITFRGALQPLRPDGAASRVTFRFYQKKSGTWVLKYERHVATDGSGVARTTFKFGVGGNWYVMCFADRTPVNAVSRYSQREYFFVQ